MTKAIAIRQNGVRQEYTGVARLKTNRIGGGSVGWLAEDESRATSKTIQLNGTYAAASDGYYGYDVVTVDVPPAPQPPDRCVFGFNTENNVEYMACTKNGRLKVREFPSYVSITPYTDSEIRRYSDYHHIPYHVALMRGDGEEYSEFRDHDSEDIISFNNYDPNNEDQVREIKGQVARSSKDIVFVGGTVELWLSEPVRIDYVDTLEGANVVTTEETWYSGDSSIDNLVSYGGEQGSTEYVLNTSFQGNSLRFEFVRIQPWRIFARPTWIEEFEEYMEAEFNDEEYVIRGRPMDDYIEFPYRQYDDENGLCYRARIIGDYPDRYWLIPVDEVGDVEPESMKGIYSIYDSSVY